MECFSWDRRCLLLTNHALVMAVIEADPRVRIRTIAERVEISERAVESLIHDLIEVGFLSRRRVGRRNVYEVHRDRRLRHPLVEGHTVGHLLQAIVPTPAGSTPEAAFGDHDPGAPNPEKTLPCADPDVPPIVRSTVSSTKEGITMKRVLYIAVAALLVFASVAVASTNAARGKPHHTKRHHTTKVRRAPARPMPVSVRRISVTPTAVLAARLRASLRTSAVGKQAHRNRRHVADPRRVKNHRQRTGAVVAGATVKVAVRVPGVTVAVGRAGVKVGVKAPALPKPVRTPGGPVNGLGGDPLHGLGL